MRRRRADGALPAHTGRAKRSAVARALHKFLSPSYVRDRAYWWLLRAALSLCIHRTPTKRVSRPPSPTLSRASPRCAGKPALPGRDFPLEGLTELHDRIMAEVPGISRIALDITSKPPATTEWE